jgi:hypothetical protein
MPGFSKCCAGIGDSGSFSTRGGGAECFDADFFAADFFAADLLADLLAADFADFFALLFFAPCLFVLVAISSPCG